MNVMRSGLIAAIALTSALMPRPGLGQFGGMGGGSGGMMGGMGGGIPPGFVAMKVREVEVQSTEGGRLSGPLRLGPVVVDSEFGRYQVLPEKIRRIGLEAPGGGRGTVMVENGVQTTRIPGVVETTSGEEIAGTLLVPGNWTISTELGTLTLEPSKLKSITFRDEPEEADTPEAEGQASGASGRPGNPPRITRIGQTIWGISPSGHRVVVKDQNKGEPRTLELPASDEEPLSVVPVVGNSLAALNLEGDEIGRIAVYSFPSGEWYPLELDEPAEGRAMPLVGNQVVVYPIENRIHAFSGLAGRWDVLELPEGVSAVPTVSMSMVTVEHDGQLHTFNASSGRWEHTDVRKLLGIDEVLEELDAEGPDAAGEDTDDEP